MFLLETSEVNELAEIIEGTLKILRSELNQELRRDFGSWLRGMLVKRDIDIDFETLNEMEVRPMLETNFQRHDERLLEKGREEGKAEGKAEGMEIGRLLALRESIALLMRSKFGEDAQSLISTIDAIDSPEKLESLMKAAIAAARIEDVRRSLGD